MVGRINVFRFKVIPIRIPISFVTEIEKESQNPYGTTKDLKYPKNILSEKKKKKASHSLVSKYTKAIIYKYTK